MLLQPEIDRWHRCVTSHKKMRVTQMLVVTVVNTPTRKGPATDEGKIRATAVLNRVPIVTTLTAASAAARAIAEMRKADWGVRPLQEYFAG